MQKTRYIIQYLSSMDPFLDRETWNDSTFSPTEGFKKESEAQLALMKNVFINDGCYRIVKRVVKDTVVYGKVS